MIDLLALITIMLWPVVPLFWIPVHGLPRLFKKIGLLTYVMPVAAWLPLAYIIYEKRGVLLQYRIDLPPTLNITLNITGLFLLAIGALLHIWTGKLLGFWGLIGLPEISTKIKGRFVTKGPFSVVRHPTYLAHTLMFSGIFLITGAIAVGIITLLDFILINTLIIPLEEKELLLRFGEDYRMYKNKVPRFFPGTLVS